MVTGSLVFAHTHYTDAKAVTLDSSNDLPSGTCRAIVVTAAGTVIVDTEYTTSVTIQCAAGIPMPLAIKRCRAGGTATGVVALY